MLVKVIVLLFIGSEICKACETGQTKQGCLIRNLVCACGIGCISDYRYDTYQECQNALKGKKKDICKTSNPCLHNGTCIQISQQPGYKCRCEGTGYFGLRCSRDFACAPSLSNVNNIYAKFQEDGTQYFEVAHFEQLNKTCPVPGAGRISGIFPYECIVI